MRGEERRDQQDGGKAMELISTRGRRTKKERAKLRGIFLLKSQKAGASIVARAPNLDKEV